MNKIEAVLIRYEKARAAVMELEAKRSELIRACDRLDLLEGYLGNICQHGEPCGVAAYNLMIDQNDGEPFDGDLISFDEAFSMFVNDDKGACDKCTEAMKIKRGELAAAKKEFGLAKRSMSHHAKKLIRNAKL